MKINPHTMGDKCGGSKNKAGSNKIDMPLWKIRPWVYLGTFWVDTSLLCLVNPMN